MNSTIKVNINSLTNSIITIKVNINSLTNSIVGTGDIHAISSSLQVNDAFNVIKGDEWLSIHPDGNVTHSKEWSNAARQFVDFISTYKKDCYFGGSINIHSCITIPINKDGIIINFNGETPQSLVSLQKMINALDNLKVFL